MLAASVEWGALVESVVLAELAESAVRAVWVARVSHSPRPAAPAGAPTGSTGLSTAAARPTLIDQRRTDLAEAPAVTPSPIVRQVRSSSSRGKAAMSARVAVLATEPAPAIAPARGQRTVRPLVVAVPIESAAATFPVAAAAGTATPLAAVTTTARARLLPAIAAPRA